MVVAEGQGESVGGVGGGKLGEAEEGLDHAHHLFFAGTSRSGDGQFCFGRSIFENRNVAKGGGKDSNSLRSAKGERS